MKILIADDHALFREAMRHVLAQLAEDIDLLEAGNCAQLLCAVEAHIDLALVLLDLAMPGRDGFAALDILSRDHSYLPVVVLSASENRDVMQRALDDGAVGYVPKTASATVMLQALRLVLAGGVYVPPTLVQPPAPALVAGKSGLTSRQLEVLALAIESKSNAAIAAELGLSRATIKAHMTAAFKTLGASNRAEAALMVKRLGLIPTHKKTGKDPERGS